eukprot:285642-Rhodomonas_salina.1
MELNARMGEESVRAAETNQSTTKPANPNRVHPIMVKVSFLDYGAGNIRSLRNALLRVGCEIIDVQCLKATASHLIAAAGVASIGSKPPRKKCRTLRADEDALVSSPSTDAGVHHAASRTGVGSFGVCIDNLHSKGYFDALKAYVTSGKPFYGICLGMQVALTPPFFCAGQHAKYPVASPPFSADLRPLLVQSLFEGSEETPGKAGTYQRCRDRHVQLDFKPAWAFAQKTFILSVHGQRDDEVVPSRPRRDPRDRRQVH